MKSLNEIIHFLRSTLTTKQDKRRCAPRVGSGSSAEAMEPRLLLTGDSLINGLVSQRVDPALNVESYFAEFTSVQSTVSLAEATGAQSVAASDFVTNGYIFQFGDGLTTADATVVFSDLEGISSLYPDVPRQHETRAIPNDPLFTDQWHLQNTGQGGGTVGADANVTTVWDNYTGAGVTIGIIDDGLETGHEDLAPNVNTTIDFDFNFNDDDPSPDIFDNHGTAVAGVASASGNNGTGVSGSAWDAELVGLRLIAGLTDDQLEAAALSHRTDIIDVYNNSWGPPDNGRISTIGPQVTAALEQAATTGRGGLGVIHTWAGGNGGDITNDNVNYDPYANSRFTLAVGALNYDGVRSSYSDPGAPLIVSAYSNDVGPNSNPAALGITTTDQTGAPGYSATNYANDFGGTSSATPLVSGVIALMLEANPNLSYRDVTDILARNSEQVDPSNADWVQNGAGLFVNHEYGFGGIDAAAAVGAAVSHTPLGPEETFSTGLQTVGQAIPEGGVGVSGSVTVSSADAIDSLEYVEIEFSATHASIGDLRVVLTSPDGTQSVLAETRTEDTTANYDRWVFTSARHWGESAAGDWTIEVTDNGTGGTGGTFDSFELRFFGTRSRGITVTESAGNTVVSDFGQLDSVQVSLPLPPATNVTVNVSSQDTSEVTVTPQTLVFTPANYNIPQTVAVSGVSDLIVDGNQDTDVIFAVDAAASDPLYSNTAPVVVSVSSLDNDGNLPGQPVVISPVGLIDTNRPTVEWTSVDNAFQYRVSVRDVFTGNLVQEEVVSRVTSVVLQSPFLDGAYEVTVVGINVDGQEGPASEPSVFGVGDPQPPAVPVINSPTFGSTVNDAQVPILFTDVPGALNYDIYMSTTQGVIRVEDRGTLDTTTGLRSYVTPTPFPEGNVSVWIRALDPFGGASDWSTPTRFLVDAVTTPQTPVITSPLVNVTANAFPEFSWIGDGANYELWVAKQREGTGTSQVPAVFDRTVYVRDYIGNSYTHFNPLVNGLYRVWVRARNVAGEVSAWSSFEEFTVDVPVPDTPALSVSLAANNIRPLFSWTTTGETFPLGTTFDLWVNNLSTGEARVIRERTLTGSSFRSLDDLPQGRYRAWLQASSPLGNKSSWSAAVTFDIDIASPGQPTVTGPVAVIGSSDDIIRTVTPEFAWTAQPGAAYYELWVNHDTSRTPRIVHERQVEGTTFTSETPLPQGDYRAWTRAFNVAGEPGPWSQAFAFTLDVADPVAPVITAPVVNAVGTVADSTPTIAWTSSGVSVVDYQLQLEEVATGTRVLDITDIAAEEYTIPDPLSEVEYRVRVRGLNVVGEASPWSTFYSFQIDVPNASTPVLISPNGEQTGSTLTFEWQHSPLNTRYEILVRDLLREENIVIRVTTFELDLTETVALHTQDGFAPGTYRWWVRAFNSENTASNWSASATFIVASNSPDESRTDESDPLASGLLEPDVLLAALPDSRHEVTPATRSDEKVQADEPARTVNTVERRVSEKRDSATLLDAESGELIQVISELADPRFSLLMDGDQRS